MEVALTKHLEQFVAEQVRRGRFETEDEVVWVALRQMEDAERDRAHQAFAAAFQDIDRHSPEGEPTPEDAAEISRIVKSVRHVSEPPPRREIEGFGRIRPRRLQSASRFATLRRTATQDGRR